MSVGLNVGSGTAYFDGIQLEKGTVLSAYNLVDNSSFERNSGLNSIPDNWTTSGNLSSTNDGIDKNVNSGDDNVYTGNRLDTYLKLFHFTFALRIYDRK